MASSISVGVEDRLEGAANFNVLKLWIKNILQDYDLEQYVTTMVEEPTNNAGKRPSGRVKKRPRESSLTPSKTI
jgi:hypothetical protein